MCGIVGIWATPGAAPPRSGDVAAIIGAQRQPGSRWRDALPQRLYPYLAAAPTAGGEMTQSLFGFVSTMWLHRQIVQGRHAVA